MSLKSRIVVLVMLMRVCDALFVSPEFDKVNVNFVYGPNLANLSRYFMRDATQISDNKNFDANRPTMLYISGWIQSPDTETSQQLIQAYLKRGDYNVLVLDWGDYSVGLYSAVLIRMCRISRILGRTMLKLFDKGLNAKSFHCVGHSFGAHGCGIMGRELYQASNRRHKFGRITGLDPAGPGFFPTASFEQPLSPSDADFVDAIHSDVFFIGTKFPVGHADFYPNYNMIQPACPRERVDSFFDFINSLCSHLNAIRYWVDSVKPKYGKLFPSYQCASWKEYQAGRCSFNPTNYMGIEAKPNVTGKFFIRVQSKHFYDGKAFYEWVLKRIGNRLVNLANFNF